MKTYEQLMKHYWGKIVPMAEAAGINPWECVQYCNMPLDHYPIFNGTHAYYTFALTVLEGKPLFKGDTVYWKRGGELFIWEDGELDDYQEDLTWTPPTKNRTFMFGNIELPCPARNSETPHWICIEGHTTYFWNRNDCREVGNAINNVLAAARNKE